MDMMKAANLQVFIDEPRVTRDGFAYRHTEATYLPTGETVIVNIDEWGFHPRIRGVTRVNLSPAGLVSFVYEMLGGKEVMP